MQKSSEKKTNKAFIQVPINDAIVEAKKTPLYLSFLRR
jgi:hypothetical protein